MSKLKELAIQAAPQFKTIIPSKPGVTLKMRAFLVKEQKLLLMAKESASEPLEAMVNAIKQLIENCALEPINADELTSFDIEYIFIQLYTHSTATKKSVAAYQCMTPVLDDEGNPVMDRNGEPAICGGINKVTIDLTQAKVDTSEIKSGIIEVGSPTIDKLLLAYPSFAQIAAYETAVAKDDHTTAYRMYAECLKHIIYKDESQETLGVDYSVDDALEYLEHTSGEVFERVSSFFAEVPKITSSAEFTCSKCKTHRTVHLRGLEDFF